jgi:hypothetical protein
MTELSNAFEEIVILAQVVAVAVEEEHVLVGAILHLLY